MSSLPRVRIRGVAEALGIDYGRQARPYIGASLAAYETMFRSSGWDWDRARRFANARVAWLDVSAPRSMSELRGMARGASVDVLDLLALNLRTEILQAAGGPQPEECTALGVMEPATSDGRVLVAQNWDYQVSAGDALIVLEAESPDAPFLVTVVEAGLLAKTGLNEHGVGLVTNALATDDGPTAEGMPYHFVLRDILASRSPSAAIGAVTMRRRASAANYLFGHPDGVLFDLESAPGDHRHANIVEPEEGVIVHANHFVSPPRDTSDSASGMWMDSYVRRQRLEGLARGCSGAITGGTLEGFLGDHAGHPYSICRHPDPTIPVTERSQTHFSVIYDLAARTVRLAEGPPCETPYQDLPIEWPAR